MPWTPATRTNSKNDSITIVSFCMNHYEPSLLAASMKCIPQYEPQFSSFLAMVSSQWCNCWSEVHPIGRDSWNTLTASTGLALKKWLAHWLNFQETLAFTIKFAGFLWRESHHTGETKPQCMDEVHCNQHMLNQYLHVRMISYDGAKMNLLQHPSTYMVEMP